jgi:hypothetical protein
MKRIFLFIITLALFVLPVFGQKNKALTNADKAQIIRSILLDRRFDTRYALPDEERLVVYLSTQNIGRNLVPSKIGETKILLKNPREIENEKKRLREYCAFGKFETNNSTVNVSFYYYTRNSIAEELNEVELQYEYRKSNGKWEFISRRHPGLQIGFNLLLLKLSVK